MAYITYQQYADLYGMPPINEDDFPMYATFASDMIDSITQFRIVQGGGFSALPVWVQTPGAKSVRSASAVFCAKRAGSGFVGRLDSLSPSAKFPSLAAAYRAQADKRPQRL